MQSRSLGILIIFLIVSIITAGCTGSPGTPAPSGSGAASGTAAVDKLAVSPTDAVPGQNMVSVIVKEKDYAAKIPVEFDGGMGQIHVKKVDVTVYRADGQERTATISPKRGESVELEGTKQTDRVVVYVTFDNGTRLKTNDVLSPYRTRQ
jgi:hypothetical protein